MCGAPEQVPDLVSAGLPCPAFSRLRYKGGADGRSGPAQKHPSYSTVMEEFWDYCEARRPLSFWVEEVPEFSSQISGTTQSHLDVFVGRGAALGYAIRVLKLDHSVWSEMPRVRLFIIGISEALGHKESADHVVKLILESQRYRRMTDPTRIFDIVDVDGYDEVSHRDAAQDLVVHISLGYTFGPIGPCLSVPGMRMVLFPGAQPKRIGNSMVVAKPHIKH